jgi:hypothetical protein
VSIEIPAPLKSPSFLPRSFKDGRAIRTTDLIKIHCLEFLQDMFATWPGKYKWDADVEKTGILIVDKYSFNLEAVAKRPAVVASRGPLRSTKSTGFRQTQDFDPMSGRRTTTDLLDGSVMLSVYARGIEAEMLAGFVFEWFLDFQDAIRERGSFRTPLDRRGIFKISSVSVGEEALVKSSSAPDLSLVPVLVRAMVQRRSLIVPDALKLKNIVVTVTSGGHPV